MLAQLSLVVVALAAAPCLRPRPRRSLQAWVVAAGAVGAELAPMVVADGADAAVDGAARCWQPMQSSMDTDVPTVPMVVGGGRSPASPAAVLQHVPRHRASEEETALEARAALPGPRRQLQARVAVSGAATLPHALRHHPLAAVLAALALLRAPKPQQAAAASARSERVYMYLIDLLLLQSVAHSRSIDAEAWWSYVP